MSELNTPRHSRLTFLIIAVVLVTTGTAIALWVWFAPPNTSKYEPVLQRFAAGDFSSVVNNRVDLSKDFHGLTPQDEMFVNHRDDGSYVVFIPKSYGKGLNLTGLLYTSRPLQLQDTYAKAMASTLDIRRIDVGPWNNLTVDSRVNEHWYRVSRGMR